MSLPSGLSEICVIKTNKAVITKPGFHIFLLRTFSTTFVMASARRHVVTLALVGMGAVLSCHGAHLAFGSGPRPFGGGFATLCESFARSVVD